MSVNWTKQQLVERLPKRTIAAKDVKLADYISDGYGGWQVASIDTTRRGVLGIYDEDGNGGDYKPLDQVVIVKRTAWTA